MVIRMRIILEDFVKNMYNYSFTKNGWLKFVE